MNEHQREILSKKILHGNPTPHRPWVRDLFMKAPSDPIKGTKGAFIYDEVDEISEEAYKWLLEDRELPKHKVIHVGPLPFGELLGLSPYDIMETRSPPSDRIAYTPGIGTVGGMGSVDAVNAIIKAKELPMPVRIPGLPSTGVSPGYCPNNTYDPSLFRDGNRLMRIEDPWDDLMREHDKAFIETAKRLVDEYEPHKHNKPKRADRCGITKPDRALRKERSRKKNKANKKARKQQRRK